MIGNIKETFLPKTGLQEKQLLQDPERVFPITTLGMLKMLEILAACCILHAG